MFLTQKKVVLVAFGLLVVLGARQQTGCKTLNPRESSELFEAVLQKLQSGSQEPEPMAAFGASPTDQHAKASMPAQAAAPNKPCDLIIIRSLVVQETRIEKQTTAAPLYIGRKGGHLYSIECLDKNGSDTAASTPTNTSGSVSEPEPRDFLKAKDLK
jgi:hypothetical protein